MDTTNAARPREPYDAAPGARPRWGLVAVAVAVGIAVGTALAPQPWSPGAGTLRITTSVGIATVPVEVGSSTPIAASAGALEVSLPEGAPIDGIVVVEVHTSDGLAVGEVTVRIELPGGPTETIPVISSDVTAATAQRTPPSRSGLTVGLLAAVVVLWVTEAIPLHVTSLAIPVALATGGATSAGAALAPFFHPIIALFFAGFLMAEAMRRTGLDRLAAITIVGTVGRTPATLFAGLLGTSAFLSMWMSNTAAVAVLIPIALAITATVASEGYRRAAVLGIAYAATTGGIGSAIGTPANPLALEFLSSGAGEDVGFVGWFAYGLPMVLVLLPIVGWAVWRRYRPEVDAAAFTAMTAAMRRERQAVGNMTPQQRTVLAVFIGVALLWLTQTWTDLDAGIAALAGATVLMLLGHIEVADLGRISWPSLLTFGGGLTLGFALTSTGTADWIATRLEGLAGVPTPMALAVVAMVTLALTTVASNTATAATLIPLAVPLASLIGITPKVLVPLVAIASSVDYALVVGTPPTMLAYSTGMFTARDIFRGGIALDLVGVVVLVAVVAPLWSVLGTV